MQSSDTEVSTTPDTRPALIDRELLRLLLVLLKHLDDGMSVGVIQMRAEGERLEDIEGVFRNTLCHLYFNLSRYAKAEGMPFDEEFALKALNTFTPVGPGGEA